jgi:hypothetical protein
LTGLAAEYLVDEHLAEVGQYRPVEADIQFHVARHPQPLSTVRYSASKFASTSFLT